MTTPEGKWKRKVHDLLASERYVPHIWQYAAVETGFGTRAVDKLVCIRGRFLAIECKADATKKLTERQQLTKMRIVAAGGTFLEVFDEASYQALILWIGAHA